MAEGKESEAERARRRAEAAALQEEAAARRAEGNWTGALARYRRVIEAAEALGERCWAAEVRAELGGMYQEAGDAREARRWYLAALEGFPPPDALGPGAVSPEGARRAELLRRLGEVELLAGDLEAAAARFDEALEAARRAGDALREALAEAGQAELLWARRRETEALECLARALARLQALPAAEPPTGGPPPAAALSRRALAWRQQTGSLRFRRLLEAAVPDPALRQALLDEPSA